MTGNLTLNTLEDPNAVFVFQIGSTLTAAVGSSLMVTGAGAGSDPNIFWQVGSSATLNTGTAFSDNILAGASVSFVTGSSLVNGREIAHGGAVTLLSNSVSAPTLVLSTAPGRFWNGSASNLWSATNWSSTVDGLDHVLLGSNMDVVFSVNPVPQNQNTILDTDTTISSLTVNDSAAVAIGGTNTLTLSASSVFSGNGSMLVTSPGNTTLLGTNTFSGGTTINTINTTGTVLAGNLSGNTSSTFGSGVFTLNNGPELGGRNARRLSESESVRFRWHRDLSRRPE